MSYTLDRRRFVGAAAMTLAASQLDVTGLAKAHSPDAGGASSQATTTGSGRSFPPLKQVNAGLLNVSYVEEGPADGPAAVLLLHGWPYDIYSFIDVAPLLAAAGCRVIVPYLRGYGATRFLSSSTVRNGQPAALATDVIDLMDALKIRSATLAGFDWGGRSADIVAVLWPERCKALVSVSGYLIGSQASGKVPLPPPAELQWWYQFYFATDRGRAGYAKYTHDFAKLIWQLASPKWNFSQATFDRSAAALDNPDHVDIAIHNYRWRLGLAQGETRYDELERRLAAFPPVTVPTITLEGDANGAPHPEPSAYANKFTGKYAHRTINGGIGHNLPQEAPQAFPALIKSSYFEERELPLPVYGPPGNEDFPSTTEFVADLFDGKRGAYRYLADFLAGKVGGYSLQAHDVALTAHEIRTVVSARDLLLDATQVIHGGVPAVAWRVRVGGRIIVFSGDTNGDNGNLERLAKGADLFVAHNSVPEGETGAARQLHMPPSVIGRIAKTAGVGRVVLSHRMLRTLGRESETRSVIARVYPGPVAFADDLDCF